MEEGRGEAEEGGATGAWPSEGKKGVAVGSRGLWMEVDGKAVVPRAPAMEEKEVRHGRCRWEEEVKEKDGSHGGPAVEKKRGDWMEGEGTAVGAVNSSGGFDGGCEEEKMKGVRPFSCRRPLWHRWKRSQWVAVQEMVAQAWREMEGSVGSGGLAASPVIGLTGRQGGRPEGMAMEAEWPAARN